VQWYATGGVPLAAKSEEKGIEQECDFLQRID